MAGRAGYHTVGKIKKIQVENRGKTSSPSPSSALTQHSPALADVFAKFDLSRDGTISIEEYKTLCEEYGVQLTANDIKAIREIADEDGEVRGYRPGAWCRMSNIEAGHQGSQG